MPYLSHTQIINILPLLKPPSFITFTPISTFTMAIHYPIHSTYILPHLPHLPHIPHWCLGGDTYIKQCILFASQIGHFMRMLCHKQFGSCLSSCGAQVIHSNYMQSVNPWHATNNLLLQLNEGQHLLHEILTPLLQNICYVLVPHFTFVSVSGSLRLPHSVGQL